MGLSDTPKGERIHIAVFGKRNAGKSSLINCITGQDLAIVSDVLGTTTDPVYKAMELLPLGPVMMIDTPGLDDDGVLGKQRIRKTEKVRNQADIAIIVIDGEKDLAENDYQIERQLADAFRKDRLPFLTVLNKAEACKDGESMVAGLKNILAVDEVYRVSAKEQWGVEELKEKLGTLVPQNEERKIVSDLLEHSDFVVLVVPIDKAAPKGRLILPQQQTIRDIIEANAISIVVRETELKDTLAQLGKKPKLVITDSQAFEQVAKDTPEDIWLTSFSILFSRYKGDLEQQVRGILAVEQLKDGDVILMAEGCTHHRQCDDIGTVKIPKWLRTYTGKELVFETSSGTGYPDDLSQYALIVHCGGCTLNRKEMQFRLKQAKSQEVPIVNYGVLIAHMKGILKRSLEPFEEGKQYKTYQDLRDIP